MQPDHRKGGMSVLIAGLLALGARPVWGDSGPTIIGGTSTGHGSTGSNSTQGPCIGAGVAGAAVAAVAPVPAYAFTGVVVGQPPMPPPPVPYVPDVIEVPPPRALQFPPARRAQRQLPRDPARSRKLLVLGDRLVRAGSLSHARDRYEQALRADPGSAQPRVRLAELAVIRGDYKEAADRLREAQAAEPGWLAFPDDIQGLWPEPRQFAAMLGRIESHLQAHPEDRDAWLVLGAQLHLSGRHDLASDVFLRLTDRPPGPLLTAFLNAARPVGRPR